MFERREVYKAIDDERDYQDRRWNPETTESGGRHSVAEFILYMEHYLHQARVEASTKADPESRIAALDIIRKVTALGVVCMEQNGIVSRND